MKRNVMFKILLMIVVGLFLSLDAFAQQMTVKGIVKDTTGEPIIGANVVVKGSSNGQLPISKATSSSTPIKAILL